jgi:hypothetical protein
MRQRRRHASDYELENCYTKNKIATILSYRSPNFTFFAQQKGLLFAQQPCEFLHFSI